MSAIRTADLDALLHAIRRCESRCDLASFRATVLEALEQLVSCDRVAYATDIEPRPGGDSLALELPGCERIVLTRRHGPFPERDRELIALVRPHLAQAARRALARAASARLVSALERTTSPEPAQLDPAALCELGLTAREAEVLVHADGGLDSHAIAAAMSVSPRTVQKHLEHAFAKLEVPTRVAALAKVRGAERM